MTHRTRLLPSLVLIGALGACGAPESAESTSAAFLAGDEDRFYEAAIADLNRGDVAAAEANFRQALTANPRYLAAHLALGEMLLDAERFADAEAAFTQAVTLRDLSVDGHAGLARALYAQGDLDGAETHAQRAVSLTDQFTLESLRAATYTLLGEVQAARGNDASAEVAFNDALAVDSTWTNARIELARLFARTDRMPDAVRMLTTAEAFEEDPDTLLALGSLYFELHLWDRAVDALQRALDNRPGDLDVTFYLGAANLRLGRQEIGIQLVQQVIDAAPDYLDAYAVRGRGELARGTPDAPTISRAEADANFVLGRDPNHYQGLILAGEVAHLRADNASAEARFRAAQQASPRDIDATEMLADLLYDQRRWTEYTELVEPLIDRVDAPARWRGLLVEAFLGAGDLRRSLHHKSILADSRPADYELHRDVARAALDHPGSLPDDVTLHHARVAYERSGGGTIEYRLLFFDALWLNGLIDEAETQLDVAERAWPRDPQVRARREQFDNR